MDSEQKEEIANRIIQELIDPLVVYNIDGQLEYNLQSGIIAIVEDILNE